MKFIYLLQFLLVVNLIALVAVVVDKLLAIKRMPRISEKILFIISALGGALLMYFTMLYIRHKTKHNNFMIGLPCIIIVQLAILFICKYYGVLY